MGASGMLAPSSSRDAALDKLGKKADHLKDTLQVLDRLTDEAGQLLDSLGSGLATLNTLTAPIKSRASALTVAQTNIAAAKGRVDELVEHVSTSRRVAPVLEQGPGKDLDAFLEGLAALEAANTFLSTHSGLAACREALAAAQGTFDRALEQCGADFKATLASGARSVMLPPGAFAKLVKSMPLDTAEVPPSLEAMPPALLPKLGRMARLMEDSGYTPAQAAYVASRGGVLQQLLGGLSGEVPPLATLQTLPQEQLERVVAGWALQVKGLALAMVSERQLAEEVWGEDAGGELFVAAIKPRLAPLLAAGRDITEARRTPEKVFLLLDMHQSIAQLAPLFKSLLGGPDAAPGARALLSDLASLLSTVATSAASLFSDYEDGVAQDGSKVLPLDGTIHPLTAQVVSYIKRLLGYSNASEVLCGGNSRFSDPGGFESRRATLSSMSLGVARLLMQLTENLITKSRGYKADPLSHLFLMNNVHYVQWSVEGSPGALALMGQEWLERHKDLVEEYGAKYHEAVWMPLVRLLQEEPPTDAGRLKQVLKDTFTSFNAAIERIYTNQSGWTIPDASLRDAVKRVIKDDLLAPYSAFLRKHAEVQFTANPAKYIKYTVQDVVSIIDDDLFETKAVSMNKLSLRKEKLDAIV